MSKAQKRLLSADTRPPACALICDCVIIARFFFGVWTMEYRGTTALSYFIGRYRLLPVVALHSMNVFCSLRRICSSAGASKTSLHISRTTSIITCYGEVYDAKPFKIFVHTDTSLQPRQTDEEAICYEASGIRRRGKPDDWMKEDYAKGHDKKTVLERRKKGAWTGL